MRTKRVLCLAMVAMFVVAFSATGWAQATKTLDIGIVVPLTGPAANIGSNHRNAVLLAIENQNAKGGVTIAGQKYVLNAIVRDSKFDSAVAKTVTEEVVYNKKVKVIFGATPIETSSMQSVTEPNKVILFIMAPTKGHTGPDKPYSFSDGGHFEKMYVLGGYYIKKHYPKAKRVVSVYPDLSDGQVWEEAEKKMMQYFGFEWLGLEKFAINTIDFAPIIAKILAKKPDVVDLAGCGPAMGAIVPIFVKQLRQAGFNEIIWMPTVPPPGVMETAVPKQYLNKIVTNEFSVDSPVVTKEYKNIYNQYMAKFKTKPMDFMSEAYNVAKAFFEFLNTQKTMDTAAWMRGLENYRWNGIFGHEEYWIGKPNYGINRFVINSLWASEWKDGKLGNTEMVEKFPYELFVSK